MEEKTPRAVRWDLHNISKALLEINPSEIEEEKVSIIHHKLYTFCLPFFPNNFMIFYDSDYSRSFKKTTKKAL